MKKIKRIYYIIKNIFIYLFAKYGLINSERQINVIKLNKKIKLLKINDNLLNFYNKSYTLPQKNAPSNHINNTLVPVIVSLTSFPQRIAEVKYTLYSLLDQSVKPKKIILWLAEEQFHNKEKINKTFQMFYKFGIEIKYTKDIGSYKKIIPALNTYNNEIIVTADDDIYYDKYWLEELYKTYLNHKKEKVAVCHRMHKITIKNNKICPYIQWEHVAQNTYPSPFNFATSGGGILFPPNCFYKDVTCEKLFTKLSGHGDDIWLWAMLIMNGWSYICVSNNKFKIKSNSLLRDLCIFENLYALSRLNVIQGRNDKQLNNILDYYNLRKKLLLVSKLKSLQTYI